MTILGDLISGLSLKKQIKRQSLEDLRIQIDAIHVIMHAVARTKAYMYDRDIGEVVSRETEVELSLLWRQTSDVIWPNDVRLHRGLHIKAWGWADPREWEMMEDKTYLVNLDNIEAQCR